ncbi:MAG: two-component system response regulator [Magnetococcales bacterium]|nr:two-component system response regulator [Magnetococcales bacterium]
MNSTRNKATVLIVDDTPENIDLLGGILRSEYKIKIAMDGQNALRIAASQPQPDMILLDVMMPDMDGYEVCRRLKSNPATAPIPVIFITARSEVEDERKGIEMGAMDYIVKPISPPIVESRVRSHLALYNHQRHLENIVRERTEELIGTRLEIIRRLGRAAEFRDNETGLHVIRMSHYARLIAQSLNISDEWTELIFHAAPMHDIGKIGIPDRVLLKPGRLDEEEWVIMRTHPHIGSDIIGDHDSELLRLSRQIALTHHEKWDGSGYPQGLQKKDIPLSGRIVAIADVFDALTSKRPYKEAWSVTKALEIIDQGSESHFDPALVSIFHGILPEALEIKKRYAETDITDP